MAPYKIQCKAGQYRAILWQDDQVSPWFFTRVEALHWAFVTIARIDANSQKQGA